VWGGRRRGRGRLERAVSRRRARDGTGETAQARRPRGGDGAGGGAVGSAGKGCLERAVSREPSRDGALETARARRPRPRGGDEREAAQRDGASETARTRRLGRETAWARSRTARRDGPGRETARGGRWRDGGCRGGKLLTVEPFGGDTLPASSVGTGWLKPAGYPSAVRCLARVGKSTPDPYPWTRAAKPAGLPKPVSYPTDEHAHAARIIPES